MKTNTLITSIRKYAVRSESIVLAYSPTPSKLESISSLCKCKYFLTSTSALGPHKSASLLALSRLNVLALGERSPEVSHEVGPLLNVLVAKNRSNGPGSFLAVIEGNATRF